MNSNIDAKDQTGFGAVLLNTLLPPASAPLAPAQGASGAAARSGGYRRVWRRMLWVCCCVVWPITSPAQSGCKSHEPVPWVAVAPDVWVWLPGAAGDVSRANAGHVIPTSLIVSRGEALVIDPGPSHRHGIRLRRSIECRFKARVTAVVNTHAHAENVLANSAFADGAAAGRLHILASAATQEGMALRCPDCLASLIRRVGEEGMAGTRIVLPDRVLREGDVLRVGALRLQVLRVEQGHTEGDLVLWNRRHRLLWAGGLVYDGRVPELAQGRVDEWLAALKRLEALQPRQLLSTVWSVGEGQAAPPALQATRSYLQALRERTLQAMDEGAQPQDNGRVELPAFQHWHGYAERHGFNVLRAWRELEPLWMDQGKPAEQGDAPGTN